MKKNPTSTPVDPASRHHECAGCCIRQETIEFLRDQLRVEQQRNDQLQNKLLALTGDAADRYQKLRVMELAQSNSTAMTGVLPGGMMGEPSEAPDEFDNFVEQLHSGMTRRES